MDASQPLPPGLPLQAWAKADEAALSLPTQVSLPTYPPTLPPSSSLFHPPPPSSTLTGLGQG